MSNILSSKIGYHSFSCKYPSCKNSYFSKLVDKNYQNKKFYRFPKSPTAAQNWKRACQVSPLKNCQNYFICEDHFSENDLVNLNGPKRLKHGAVPHSPVKNQSQFHSVQFSDASSNIQFRPSVLFPAKDPSELCIDPVYINESTDDSFAGPSHQASNVSSESESKPKIHISSNILLKQADNLPYSLPSNSSNNKISINTNTLNDSMEKKDNIINNENTPYNLTSIFSDHAYCKSTKNFSKCSKMASEHEFSFLNKSHTVIKRQGILSNAGLKRAELSPRKEKMFRFHQYTLTKLSKLRLKLKNKNADLSSIKNLYEDGCFQFIESNLNEVTKDFINSQLKNCLKSPNARRWTSKGKALALSMYKRSPKLYRYLRFFFQLPSIRTLKRILSAIPIKPGIIEPVLEHLKRETESMDELDKTCTLIFDEMFLSAGLFYETKPQRICGFENMGTLGNSSNPANHALVFMIRGLKRNFKMPVAFYFINATVKANILKQLIVELIIKLQEIGLIVVATVCDQGPTNRSAIKLLTEQYCDTRPSPYHFVINSAPIVTIFDIPHLLKNTRNCLLNCKIEFENRKFAKFSYITNAFEFDQTKRTYKCLHKLSNSHFNFKDTFSKMKVSIAARQLSQAMAATIETAYLSGNIVSAESLDTANFIHNIDNLFDSLNSNQFYPSEGKKYRCALSDQSPHLEFWSEMLNKLFKWKIWDNSSGIIRNDFHFVDGWITSIRAIIYLWQKMREKGLKFLCLRNLNQDPLENFFGQIRQHGISNTNPTCFQFTAAFKTLLVTNFTSTFSKNSNCEADSCNTLGNFAEFLENFSENRENIMLDQEEEVDFDDDSTFIESNPANAYVAGYLLDKLGLDLQCSDCLKLFSGNPSQRHSFVTFKEYDSQTRLKYADEKVIDLLETLDSKLFDFLDKFGTNDKLEVRFKNANPNLFNQTPICEKHSSLQKFFDKAIRLGIFKYVKKISQKKRSPDFSKGHKANLKKFKNS